MHKALRLVQLCCILIGSLLSSVASATGLQYNMTRGVTPVSHAQYDLHMTVLFIVTAIGVLVFGLLIFSIFRYRKSKGAKAATFHENVQIEVIWTVIPFVILMVLAVPATKTLIAMEDTRKSEMTIAVTGYQWYWHYEYLNEDISFYSNPATTAEEIAGLVPKSGYYQLEVDKPLVVPTNTKIRFAFSANDVIHAWWVPALGVKRDTIPGFINESWAVIEEVGTYRGQCAELCGVRHGYMPIVVEAITPEEFEAWVAEQKGGLEEVIEESEA